MTGRARGVIVIPVLFAIGATLLGARLMASRERTKSGGPTYLAYRVDSGQPLSFPILPGERDVAVTVQVAAPGEAEVPVRFAMVAELRDLEGRELWRGRSVLDAAPGGTVIEGAAPVSAPRTLRLAVPGNSARLVLRVEAEGATAPGFAVLRMVRRRERTSLDTSSEPTLGRARQLGDRGSLFGWAYLDETGHQVLLNEPLRRRAAIEENGERGELVHVQLSTRRRPSPPPAVPGELVERSGAAAYTARGPGRLRLNLAAEDGGVTAATVRATDHQGRSMLLPVPVLGKGTDVLLLVPDGGALTVAVEQPRVPVRARVFASGGARRLGDAVDETVPSSPPVEITAALLPSVLPAGGRSSGEHEIELVPDRRRSALWRLHPAGPPAIATLVGDGSVRIEARPVAAGRVGHLRWRLVAGDTTLSSGVLPVVGRASLYDRLVPTGDETVAPPAGEPMIFVAAGPVGARLELTSVGAPIDVQLLAVDESAESKLAAAYEVPLDHARLRHAPRLRQRQTPFLPDNHRELEVSAGRPLLEGQVRLEPSWPGSRPAGPFRTVEPLAPRTRQLLVEDDAGGDRWGFAVGEETRLTVEERGRDAGRLVLDYRLGPEALGGSLQLFVDGAPVEQRLINVTRGRMRLGGLAPGEHPVAVVGPPGLVLTSARGAGAGSAWSERAVWRLDRGAALTVTVPLPPGETARLNVVLYSDEPLARLAELTANVQIDGGVHGPGIRLAGHTDLAHPVTVPLVALRSRWLDRQHGPVARARFAVTLGPDLGPGIHRIRISVPAGPPRLHARFFRTGRAGEPAVNYSTTEWSVD